ncbi:hypothetical protein L227DRAFT_610298 [Lentinus tigrinus ALCF2SS1-6]|uniref:Uncharacterized protein n=1 Tax=Lentinus tigrinus ALCF2SS1-6 TaxID=1328759 RepID=A0A5C2SBW6_9APHY|nr:hypothetical protein L227DRAFT_610298 [Lentinus tigrinus ALCF2SS1-6]
MSTPEDHDGPTKDHSAESELNRSDASHAPEQHDAPDKPVPEDSAGAPPTAEPPSRPQVEPPARPIFE